MKNSQNSTVFTNNPVRKDIKMANKHMKTCSTSLAIREMQSKRYNTVISNVGEDVEENCHSFTAGEDVQPFWKIVGQFL